MAVSVVFDGRDRAHHLLRRIARTAGLPVVALLDADARCSAPPLADALTAVRLHCSVAEAGLQLAPNAERRLHSRDALARRYPPTLLAETLKVAARCTFSLDELRYEYPEELVPAGETAGTWLRRLVEGGLAWRYGRQPALGQATRVAAQPPVPYRRRSRRSPPGVRSRIEHN